MSTSVYLRDKERALTWVMSAVSAVALSVGAWFFSGLAARMDKLSESISDLRTQVAVSALQAQRLDELRDELKAHKNNPAAHGMADLARRVERLETR